MARVRFDRLVEQAEYPGSGMIPATSALLSLLVLKLLDKGRRSHISDFNCDEALGLFAGLNVLPKTSFATKYSYRTGRDHQLRLLSGWIKALAPLQFPEGHDFSLEFHAIPFRGDPTPLKTHYLPMRGKAGPSVLSFFAQEKQSRVLCYANANLTRTDQPGEVMRLVEFWHAVTGQDPQWLYFDSKVVPDRELSLIGRRGIRFVTIRKRGAAVIRRLRGLPSTAWRGAVIDTPKRCHQHVRYVDEQIKLPGYEGPIRQLAVDGLGRERPTLFRSNDLGETARSLIIRYAGRNRVEDGLGTSVNFFHLDYLASEVRLNVDLDVALTVVANGCYRWLAHGLKGFSRSAPKQVFRKFVETSGELELQAERIVIQLDRRCHNPIIREAKLDEPNAPIFWVNNHRDLNMKRRDHLSRQERMDLGKMLGCLPELKTLRRSVDRLQLLFAEDQSESLAWRRQRALVKAPEFQAVPKLAKAMEMVQAEKFAKMIAILKDPACRRVRTNNHAERINRMLRHQEKARYK